MSLPRNGDRILIVKDIWLQLLLSGEKTLEIRGRAMKPGVYFLGHRGQIHAKIIFDVPFRIEDKPKWSELAKQHRVYTPSLPYCKTWALPVLHVERLDAPVPYTHPRGAVGIVVYRELVEERHEQEKNDEMAL